MYMVCSVGHQQNEKGAIFLTRRLDCDFSLLLKKKYMYGLCVAVA